jgi:hypothetical protein
MRRAIVDAVGLAALGGGAVVVIAAFEPDHTNLAVDAYLLFLGALALLALTRITREATEGPSEFERAVRPPRRRRAHDEPYRLPELARVEREVTLARLGAFDLHVRLRPTLREVAEHRLLSRHGVGLDEEPTRARELLGATAWDVVRPDRPAPEDRHAPGLERRQLREVVDALERL